MHAYGKGGKIVNSLNTLVDSQRTAIDITSLRFALRYFNRPMFFFKGSFVVCKHFVEKFVGFDHGLEGSIAEDAYFACTAANKGFTFDWIEGEMHETSPFTLGDFLRQRRRWNQGLYLVCMSKKLKLDFTSFLFK